MKRKLINSFIILSGSTMIAKIFSILNRMLLSRLLNTSGMALYILVIPTLSLCITFAQFSVPSAVFRLVSHPKYSNKKIIISAFAICFVSCLLITISILAFSYPISHYFLKREDALLPLLCMIPFIPLVALSGIIKNYYLGKEDVWTLSLAQLFEEIARIVFTYIMLSCFHNSSLSLLVAFAILSMSVGESISLIYLYAKLNDQTQISSFHLNELKNHFIFKDLLHIALPLTGSRLLHVFYNFLEPIILISLLSSTMSKSDIHLNYAILSGYVISLLMTPTFFNNVILRLIVPIFNRDIAYKQYPQLRIHLFYSLFASFLVSLPFTLLFYLFSEQCLMIMYNTSKGHLYLKYMAIPFVLFYLQTPLSALLQCLNKNKALFVLSVLEIIIEFICLIVFIPRFQVLAVAISLLLGLFVTLFLSAYLIYQVVFHLDR